MSRTSVNRTAIYTVIVPDEWIPQRPWNIPPSFTDGVLIHRNCNIMEARDFVRVFNRGQAQWRAKDKDGWDRKWAFCVPCVRIPTYGQQGVQP